MSQEPNRRDVLEAFGTATAASVGSASIVAADPGEQPTSGTADHPVLSDLKVRSLLIDAGTDVDVTVTRRNEGGQVVSRTIPVQAVTNGKAPSPREFDVKIPQGEYTVEVRVDGDLVAEQDVWAPKTGYPDHRQLVVTLRESGVELHENVV